MEIVGIPSQAAAVSPKVLRFVFIGAVHEVHISGQVDRPELLGNKQHIAHLETLPVDRTATVYAEQEIEFIQRKACLFLYLNPTGGILTGSIVIHGVGQRTLFNDAARVGRIWSSGIVTFS